MWWTPFKCDFFFKCCARGIVGKEGGQRVYLSPTSPTPLSSAFSSLGFMPYPHLFLFFSSVSLSFFTFANELWSSQIDRNIWLFLSIYVCASSYVKSSFIAYMRKWYPHHLVRHSPSGLLPKPVTQKVGINWLSIPLPSSTNLFLQACLASSMV